MNEYFEKDPMSDFSPGRQATTWFDQALRRFGSALLLAVGLVTAPALAQDARNGLVVTLPNGYPNVTVDDLRISSTAGTVRWMRVWDGQEWKFNPHWESLSQSWKNLTGSQSADTTAGTLPIPAGSASSLPTLYSGGGGEGCWVWVDEDWQPSNTAEVINGVPQAEAMSPTRTTPFNHIMGEDPLNYPPPRMVNIDYQTLCAGASSNTSQRDAEAFRRASELYVGDEGRYAFNNRTVIEKRGVRQLAAGTAVAQYASLATGQIAIAPVNVANGFRWIDKTGDWIDFNTQGQVVAWGDKNDNTVWLLRDSTGIVRGAVDYAGRVLFSLHYTGQLLTEVRDYPANAGDIPARSVKYQYDAKNRLTTVTDVRGNTSKYDYDGANQITKLTDQEGRSETLVYGNAVVKQRIAPDGGVTDYFFDYDDTNKQFVSKITGPETAAGRRVDDYTHNRIGKLVRMVVNGRTDVEVRYDTAARAETMTNARGFATKITHSEYDKVAQVDYADGSLIKRSYSAANLMLTEETDELGVKTQYQYDAKGNPSRRIEAAGTADEQTTDYAVNALGQITKVTRRGRTESNGTITPDAVWAMEFDALGQTSKITDPEGNSRQFVYSRSGDLLRLTDARSNATAYDVDPAGNLLTTTDALGRGRSYRYDKVGNALQLTDARAKVTLAAYDALNRQTQVTNSVGGTRRAQYNAQGQPVAETDEDGRISRSEFDNFLRLSKEVDGLGNATTHSYTLSDGGSGTLGSLGDPTESAFPTFTRRQRFDARDRLTSETLLNPNSLGTEGLVSSSQYDKRGQRLSDTDANGKTRFYAYDAIGRLTQVTDSLGNKTQAFYDARGNLIQITDAKGNVNRFTFDRSNRVVKETLPLGQVTTTTFDAEGNVKERTDPNGYKAAYTVDAGNRVVEIKQYRPGAVLARTTSFTWDAEDNLVAWSDIDATRNQTASATATFDAAGRRTAETVTYPFGNTLSYGYAYSPAGYKTQLTWPDGTVIGYGYSAHGELETVTIPGEGSISVSQFKWTEPAKVTLPGGSTQERALDGLLNLEALKVKTPGQQTVLSVANTYGKVQELKQSNRTDTVGTASSTKNTALQYDSETRLTQATVDSGGSFGTETETFTLDALGNRIAHSKVSGVWTYDGNNRLLQRGTGANATNYVYDEAGNLTRKSEPGGKLTQYAYDTQNRLIEVKDGGNNLVARYGYDPLDRRIWKEQYRDAAGAALVPGKRTTYLYGEEGLIAEAMQSITLNADQSVNANGLTTVATQYGPRPGADFTTAMLFIKTQNSNGNDTFGYFHHDQIGTPVQATDKAGTVVWAANYNVFGQASITTPAATTDKPTIAVSLRLAGQTEDPETGLHYNFRRYYEPAIGRYISQDPIGLRGGDNPYRYAEANPQNITDPTGECPFCAAYAVCVAECFIEATAINLITGECNNFGDTAKSCAASCLAGLGIGKLFKTLKSLWDRIPCALQSFPDDTVVRVRPPGSVPSDALTGRAVLKPIGDVSVGDEVLAYQEWAADAGKSGTLVYELVTDIYSSSRSQEIFEIALSSGERIRATAGHPFKTSEGWRDASFLKVGDTLLSLNGIGGVSAAERSSIAAISVSTETIPVHNLQVANAHAYFVGLDGQLAHNVHGNSRSCNKFQYLYEIFNKTTGKTEKFGVTSVPPNAAGRLPRPTSQLGKNEDYRIVGTDTNRGRIYDQERNAVDNYRQNSPNNARPPRQRRP